MHDIIQINETGFVDSQNYSMADAGRAIVVFSTLHVEGESTESYFLCHETANKMCSVTEILDWCHLTGITEPKFEALDRAIWVVITFKTPEDRALVLLYFPLKTFGINSIYPKPEQHLVA